MPCGAGPAQQLVYAGTLSWAVDHAWEGVEVPAERLCRRTACHSRDSASGSFPSPESREAASSQEPRGPAAATSGASTVVAGWQQSPGPRPTPVIHTHSFVQQVFAEHLLCMSCWEVGGKQDRSNLCPENLWERC